MGGVALGLGALIYGWSEGKTASENWRLFSRGFTMGFVIGASIWAGYQFAQSGVTVKLFGLFHGKGSAILAYTPNFIIAIGDFLLGFAFVNAIFELPDFITYLFSEKGLVPNLANARNYASLSWRSYKSLGAFVTPNGFSVKIFVSNADEISAAESHLTKQGITDISLIDNTTTRTIGNDLNAYVIQSKTDLVIIFRPTENNWLDTLTDFSFFPLGLEEFEGKTSTFHVGFYNALNDLWGKFFNELKNLVAGKRVITIGQSYGGALAQICAYKLLKEDIPVDELYTFGGPRVGDKTFAETLNKKIPISFRFVNEGDPIPELPFKSFGYYHADSLVFLEKDVKKMPTSVKGDLGDFSDPLFGGFSKIADFILAIKGFIVDHNAYI